MISHYNLKYKDDLRLDLHLPDGEEFDLFVYFHVGCTSVHWGVKDNK